jgi:hypothetical protein
MHVFAMAHASIRILITGIELWKMQITLKKKFLLISVLICATGVGTMPLTGIQLELYLTYKEEGISAETLRCRLLEAGLNVFFICFSQALKLVLSWLGKNDGATGEHILLFRTKRTQTSRYFESCQELENQKG